MGRLIAPAEVAEEEEAVNIRKGLVSTRLSPAGLACDAITCRSTPDDNNPLFTVSRQDALVR